MDFLLDALEEIAGEVCASVADLLNLARTSCPWTRCPHIGRPDDEVSRRVQADTQAFGIPTRRPARRLGATMDDGDYTSAPCRSFHRPVIWCRIRRQR
jgi:hypothetical protein